MKRKNGFTLIELLVIIVILAIIAVITVPVVLGIIDNSKKKTTKDSALGYKRAVEQYYATKLMNNNIDNLPTDTIMIPDMPNDFTVTGDAPTDGWIELDNGEVVAFSLVFKDYVVEYDGTTEPTVAKATEIQNDPCPGCVFLNDTRARFIYDSSGSAGKTTTLSDGDYTTDYTTLTSGDVQLNYFLGHKIDNDGKILKSYACGLKNGELFCIEGYNPAKYNSNKRILDSIFSDCTTTTNNGVEQYNCDPSGLHISASTTGVINLGGCSINDNGHSQCSTTK